ELPGRGGRRPRDRLGPRRHRRLHHLPRHHRCRQRHLRRPRSRGLPAARRPLQDRAGVLHGRLGDVSRTGHVQPCRLARLRVGPEGPERLPEKPRRGARRRGRGRGDGPPARGSGRHRHHRRGPHGELQGRRRRVRARRERDAQDHRPDRGHEADADLPGRSRPSGSEAGAAIPGAAAAGRRGARSREARAGG
ncbi:MAG: hypothetical protein AVDCRST_MAG30-3509, partial [uncultured Solirubrobacteraceae bacterium]